MAVNLINVYVHRIRLNFRLVRLLGRRFEKINSLKSKSNLYNISKYQLFLKFFLELFKMANRNFCQSRSLQEHVPQQM